MPYRSPRKVKTYHRDYRKRERLTISQGTKGWRDVNRDRNISWLRGWRDKDGRGQPARNCNPASRRPGHFRVSKPSSASRMFYVKQAQRNLLTSTSMLGTCATKISTKLAVSNTKSFRSVLAERISERLVQKGLLLRRRLVGNLIKTVRRIRNMDFPKSGFGQHSHSRSSEPYFYDSAYKVSGKQVDAVKMRSTITGIKICRERPSVRELCKTATKKDERAVRAVLRAFKKNIPSIREELHAGSFDKCGNVKHPTRKNDYAWQSTDKRGHSLQCEDGGCNSSKRVIRNLAVHYPLLRNLLRRLYAAHQCHFQLLAADNALRTGDVAFLRCVGNVDLGNVVQFKQLDSSKPDPLTDDDIVLLNADLFAAFNKEIFDFAALPCMSCCRLSRRSDVTRVDWNSDFRTKFTSRCWEILKEDVESHPPVPDPMFICSYCRPVLNRNALPSRCYLNGLSVPKVPEELKCLDAISLQLIQRVKAFQTIIHLGTQRGILGVCKQLKASKGFAFYLPLPLTNTLETLEKRLTIKDNANSADVLFILNGNPTKSNVIWKTLVNFTKLEKAVNKLKQINPFYCDIDSQTLGELSKGITPVVNEGDKKVLRELSADDIANFQHFTVRHLDSRAANTSDIAQFQLSNVDALPLDRRLQYLDVLSFPQLFPTGAFGKYYQRDEKISDSEWAKSKLLHQDSRFRRDAAYVFSLFNDKVLREINNGIYNLLKCSAASMPVSDILQRLTSNDTNLEANLFTVFQKVRGTSQFWFGINRDLKSMMHDADEPPTFFLTLSCAEYWCQDIDQYLHIVNDVAATYPADRLCAEDPVSVGRQFEYRFRSFLRIFILQGNVLGNVTRYFWKKEYQTRGAPHYHILLWVADAPVAGRDNPGVVLEYINRYITCRKPSENESPRLHALVRKFQTHQCMPGYCQRKRQFNGVFVTHCRFGYPKPPAKQGSLREIGECMSSRTKTLYELPRSIDESRINGYNPILLLAWGANIDIKYIGERSIALANYITDYCTKAERSDLQEVYNHVVSDNKGNTLYSRLFSAVCSIVGKREVGMHEAADELLGHHLYGRSHSVQFVDVAKPSDRKRRLKNYSTLQQLSADNPQSTDIFLPSLVDTHYPNRPVRLDEVCLHDFASEYTKSGLRADGQPEYRKLEKSKLVTCTNFDLDTEAGAEKFFYSVLLLFVPFRQEGDILGGYSSATEAYNKLYADNVRMRQFIAKRRRKHDLDKFLEELRRKHKDNGDGTGSQKRSDAAPGTPDDGKVDVVDITGKKLGNLPDLVKKLNKDQLRVFENVETQLVHERAHADGKCSCKQIEPLHLFVSGVGGTGKSFLIDVIHCLAQNVWNGCDGSQSCCAVTAPTGLAAFNVGGVTLHRLLSLPVEHKGQTAPYWTLSPNALKATRAALKYLRLLIIDEVSMVSSLNLAYTSFRMSEIFGVDYQVWFGGISVIFLGDLLQLRPVSGGSVFEKVSTVVLKSRLQHLACVNIWKACVQYNELSINQRQKDDQAFGDLLSDIRLGNITQQVKDAMHSRLITDGPAEHYLNLEAKGKHPVCLFPTRKQCAQLNMDMLERLNVKLVTLTCRDFVDESVSTAKFDKNAQKKLAEVNENPSKTAGLSAELRLGVGARVMLLRNLDVQNGLVNGALATVVALKNDGIELLVDNHKESCIVDRVVGKFQLTNKLCVKREQYPIIVAYAITIHKSQGLTIDDAIMDLSECFASGMAYVALSRVRSLSGLHLVQFDPDSIFACRDSVLEINRLRQVYRADLKALPVPSMRTRKRRLLGVLTDIPLKKANSDCTTDGDVPKKGNSDTVRSGSAQPLPIIVSPVVSRCRSGLTNRTGYSCYLNASIQLLATTIVPSLYPEDGTLACQVVQLAKQVLIGSSNCISSDGVQMRLHQEGLFQTGQQDAEECITKLLENLHNTMNYGQDASIVAEYFTGVRKETYVCCNCVHVSEALDTFRIYGVEPSCPHTRWFEGTEDVNFSKRCEVCSPLVDVRHVKHSAIMNLPQYLIIQFRRWSLDGVRKSDIVDLPDVLEHTNADGCIHYRLTSVIQHTGHTCNSGHYTAYIRSAMERGNMWAACDDERVTMSMDVCAADVYLALYSVTESLQ